MCPPFNDDDDDNYNHRDGDDHPICTQFIECSLYSSQQGGGVKVVQENLQSDLQLVPGCDHGDLGVVVYVNEHDHGDLDGYS